MSRRIATCRPRFRSSVLRGAAAVARAMHPSPGAHWRALPDLRENPTAHVHARPEPRLVIAAWSRPGDGALLGPSRYIAQFGASLIWPPTMAAGLRTAADWPNRVNDMDIDTRSKSMITPYHWITIG